MEGYNQYTGEIEIVKEANANIIDSGSDKDKALINVLRNEVSQLKATNASLNVKIQSLRENHLPYVFLVEDDYDTTQIITEILHDDYNIIDVGNGIEALSILRKIGKAGSNVKRIDTILLDVNLPGMCGFTLCHEIKKKMRLNIPIIVCTGRNTKRDVMRAIGAGAEDYIIKPFQEKTLISKVAKWTKTRKRLPVR
ncbi:MAG: response regulator [Candidatus Scalindua sp.]|nr:response regulator [Candidatus Scalindua sp.]MCR4345468.1 response regulator [Candidatus Scalindua sp.]